MLSGNKIQNWTLQKKCLMQLKINKHMQLRGMNNLVMQRTNNFAFILEDKGHSHVIITSI
jgi:hypothetical protein